MAAAAAVPTRPMGDDAEVPDGVRLGGGGDRAPALDAEPATPSACSSSIVDRPVDQRVALARGAPPLSPTSRRRTSRGRGSCAAASRGTARPRRSRCAARRRRPWPRPRRRPRRSPRAAGGGGAGGWPARRGVGDGRGCGALSRQQTTHRQPARPRLWLARLERAANDEPTANPAGGEHQCFRLASGRLREDWYVVRYGVPVALLACVLALGACSDDPSDPAPTEAAASETPAPAYDGNLEPAAAVLALVPEAARTLTVTDYDEVRDELGVGVPGDEQEAATFWARADAERPLLTEGLLRGRPGAARRAVGGALRRRGRRRAGLGAGVPRGRDPAGRSRAAPWTTSGAWSPAVRRPTRRRAGQPTPS